MLPGKENKKVERIGKMKVFKINESDNVAVAVENISAGETVHAGVEEITALQDIPAGHKIALTFIKKGEKVIKYGNPIGISLSDIGGNSRASENQKKFSGF